MKLQLPEGSCCRHLQTTSIRHVLRHTYDTRCRRYRGVLKSRCVPKRPVRWTSRTWRAKPPAKRATFCNCPRLSKQQLISSIIIMSCRDMSCPITLEFTSEFLTKLMFGFSNGDRSAKAKLVAISGASSAKPDLRICQKDPKGKGNEFEGGLLHGQTTWLTMYTSSQTSKTWQVCPVPSRKQKPFHTLDRQSNFTNFITSK